LSGTTDIAKIPVSLVQDSKVVLWEHIQLFFPKLVNVKKGDTGILYKLDSNSIKYEKRKMKNAEQEEDWFIFFLISVL